MTVHNVNKISIKFTQLQCKFYMYNSNIWSARIMAIKGSTSDDMKGAATILWVGILLFSVKVIKVSINPERVFFPNN